MTEAQVSRPHLLLLAGSGEARVLAEALAGQDHVQVTAALPEAGRGAALPVVTRIGRFGSREALATYLRDAGITALLDATHPFADRISHQAAGACRKLALPHAQLLRPEWRPQPGDDWRSVPDAAAAAALLKPGQRVFVTTGRGTLPDLVRGCTAQLLVRQMEAAAFSDYLKTVRYVVGEGPFSVSDEIETLRRHRIEVLLAKNSGGAASRSKLDAARALGLPVILIARPAQPEGLRLACVEDALAWVAAR